MSREAWRTWCRPSGRLWCWVCGAGKFPRSAFFWIDRLRNSWQRAERYRADATRGRNGHGSSAQVFARQSPAWTSATRGEFGRPGSTCSSTVREAASCEEASDSGCIHLRCTPSRARIRRFDGHEAESWRCRRRPGWSQAHCGNRAAILRAQKSLSRCKQANRIGANRRGHTAEVRSCRLLLQHRAGIADARTIHSRAVPGACQRNDDLAWGLADVSDHGIFARACGSSGPWCRMAWVDAPRSA